MKSYKQFINQLSETFSDKEMEISNKTSRNSSAIGEKAIVPKYIEMNADKNDDILDFGAGKHASHTQRLKNLGFKVTAHDFGQNVQPGLHDPNALNKKYHHVYASNVLNTQSSLEMLQKTLDQIHSVIHPGGKFTANLPESPRKFDGLSADLLHDELLKRFGSVKRVGGTKKAPIFHAVK